MNSDTSLLIIDAQVNMFDEQIPIHNGERILQTLSNLIQSARAAGTPVIFIRFNGKVGAPDEPGTSGWEIHPSLTPLPSEIIIDKISPDSFHKTNLHEVLQANGAKRLVLAGMQTEYCIDATCLRTVGLGYAVTAVADAHSTFDMAEMTAAQTIEQYNEKFSALAAVKNSEEIIFS